MIRNDRTIVTSLKPSAPSSSWWAGLSRDAFRSRQAEEVPRMRNSPRAFVALSVGERAECVVGPKRTRAILPLLLLCASMAHAQPNATWRPIEASPIDRAFWEQHHTAAVWLTLADGQDVDGSPGWEWQQDASGLWGTQVRDCTQLDPYRDARRALACARHAPPWQGPSPVYRLGHRYHGPYPSEVMEVLGITRDPAGVEVITAVWVAGRVEVGQVFAFRNDARARPWFEVR